MEQKTQEGETTQTPKKRPRKGSRSTQASEMEQKSQEGETTQAPKGGRQRRSSRSSQASEMEQKTQEGDTTETSKRRQRRGSRSSQASEMEQKTQEGDTTQTPKKRQRRASRSSQASKASEKAQQPDDKPEGAPTVKAASVHDQTAAPGMGSSGTSSQRQLQQKCPQEQPTSTAAADGAPGARRVSWHEILPDANDDDDDAPQQEVPVSLAMRIATVAIIVFAIVNVLVFAYASIASSKLPPLRELTEPPGGNPIYKIPAKVFNATGAAGGARTDWAHNSTRG
nr:sarcoplasmic reticulum histidine-rich calcium-binding protein-like isoform X2 [Dermacentor andersoni]